MGNIKVIKDPETGLYIVKKDNLIIYAPLSFIKELRPKGSGIVDT